MKMTSTLKPQQMVIPLIKLEDEETTKMDCMSYIFHTSRKQKYSFDDFKLFARLVADRLPPQKREHIYNQIDGITKKYGIELRIYYEGFFSGIYKYPKFRFDNRDNSARTNAYRATRVHVPDFSCSKEALNFLSWKCEEKRFTVQGLEAFCDKIEDRIKVGGERIKFRSLVKKWRPLLKQLCYGSLRNWQVSAAHRKKYREILERMEKRQVELAKSPPSKQPIKIPKKIPKKIPRKIPKKL